MAIRMPCAKKYESSNDATLAAFARGGSRSALAALVERHRPIVVAAARRTSNDTSEAEEIAQESLFHACRAIDRFRGEASFRTWLLQIVANASRSFRRKQRRRPTQSLDALLDDEPRAFAEGACVADLADEAVDRKRLASRMHGALVAIEKGHREVFVLREVLGASSLEVARRLGISEPAVRQRLRRAKSALRIRLEQAA